MRILITHQFPIEETPAPAQALATALMAAGQEVRMLVVDRRDGAADQAFVVHRVTCQSSDVAADLDFDIPRFEAGQEGQPTFDQLSEDQLNRYREALRQQVDREVDAFNPHIIHIEHVWLLAQLVLETGVPYVARAWGPEWSPRLKAPRIRELAQQAAENAGRIIVSDPANVESLRETFDVPPERIVVWPPDPADAARAVELYREVLVERFGAVPAE